MLSDEEKSRIREDEKIRCNVRKEEAHELFPPVPELITYYNVLEAIRNEIHAEHTLISHRITWCVTSQAFLLAAFAVCLSNGHMGFPFFRHALPWLGGLLAILAWIAIASAIRAQWHMIILQKKILQAKGVPEELKNLDLCGSNPLHDYTRITCSGREDRHRTHWSAMLPPFFIPIVFAWLWTFVYWWNVHLPPTSLPNSSTPQWASNVSLSIFGIVILFSTFAIYQLISFLKDRGLNKIQN